MQLQISKKTIPLRGITLNVGDVRRIVELLSACVNSERDRELTELTESVPKTDEYQEYVENLRDHAFKLSVTIEGKHGETLFGNGTDPFNSPNLPEQIVSIFISNSSAYQSIVGRRPLNSFTLNLDFSSPPLIDASSPVSSPTPNFSSLTVEGDQQVWVASIEQTVMQIINKRKNSRKFLHAPYMYDFVLWLIGFPIAMYVCWRLSDFIELYFGRGARQFYGKIR